MWIMGSGPRAEFGLVCLLEDCMPQKTVHAFPFGNPKLYGRTNVKSGTIHYCRCATALRQRRQTLNHRGWEEILGSQM